MIPLILFFIAACAFGGMVFDTPDYQSDAKWPLVYTPMVIAIVVGFLAMVFLRIVGEILVRVITLGAYGLEDI